MKLYPDSAYIQLEFDKIKQLLEKYCEGHYAQAKAKELRIHTHIDYINQDLKQSFEYKQLMVNGIIFPNDTILNLSKELKLLSLPGALLTGDQFVQIRKLVESVERIFRWFDAERRVANPALASIIQDTFYEKMIAGLINDVIDESGHVKDDASKELKEIRLQLYRKRIELRRVFDKIIGRLSKQGYLTEIEESFMNGRRVVSVYAEQKRTVKGILHGESDSRKTVFIEPEETIQLNNEVTELEHDENREIDRILRKLTTSLSVYVEMLNTYYKITGEYDFIRAKAKFAMDINGEYPLLTNKAKVHLINAYHPLLYIYNKAANKTTYPVTISLDEDQRILLISGPNAGGKTVTMKTVGLLQIMVQCGLLVPVDPNSEFGIFKQLIIHIGDTQSLEYDLSTYSSHLIHMKYLMENANGRTLFFIDELGSGTDPNLGGAFAEAILWELLKKHAFGIVTTHYLNLKIMAGKAKGIVNGAMAFDEKHLQPLYQLNIGRPGSSYTFSIAERIGLDKRLIAQARKIVDEDQYRLDKLLNSTEQNLRSVNKKDKELQELIKENERLQKEMRRVMDKEKHLQQLNLLREQNKISESRIAYLKDMERKLKQITIDWKKEDDKQKLIKQINHLLFNKASKKTATKKEKKINSQYHEVGGEIKLGDLVKMKKNYQVGEVLEIKGKRAVVKIGLLPMQVELKDLVVVKDKKDNAQLA